MVQDLIFDVGCHLGEDAAYYLQKGFVVVAVEANPELCARLKQQFSREITSNRFVLVDKAIAERAGDVEFFVNAKASIWGTIRPDVAQRNAEGGAPSEKVSVPSIRFASLIEQFGTPYYLKVDIEGADDLCLEGLLPFEDRPKFVSVEMEARSPLDVLRTVRLLDKLGYRKYKIVDQKQIPEQTPPSPAREGTYANHRFSLGSTGLFGRELDGFVSRNAFVAQYAALFLTNKMLGLCKRLPALRRLVPTSSGSWYDLHASIA